jgi:hypothetical protein
MRIQNFKNPLIFWLSAGSLEPTVKNWRLYYLHIYIFIYLYGGLGLFSHKNPLYVSKILNHIFQVEKGENSPKKSNSKGINIISCLK